MILKKKVLLFLFLFVLLVFLGKLALNIYIADITGFSIKPYELSDEEMIELNDKIGTLNSVEERALFLTSMYEIDQRVRADETTAIEKFGYETDEHANALSVMDSVDAVNLYLAKKYLDTYGYPDRSNYAETAVDTPLLIFHHKSDFTTFKQYFHYFYAAYQEGHISPHRLSFILNRKYMIKFGTKFQTDGQPLNNEQKIKRLIEKLELGQN